MCASGSVISGLSVTQREVKVRRAVYSGIRCLPTCTLVLFFLVLFYLRQFNRQCVALTTLPVSRN